MLWYENYDLENVVSPVNPDIFHQLLRETNYNEDKTNKLVDGFRNGFDIGYRGNRRVKMKAPNLKLTIGSKTELWNKVMKEVKEKRYAGPFSEIPYDHFIQSPIGLVPKDGGKATRLIFHLSYPRTRNGHEVIESLNANTPTNLTSVKYPDFSDAIRLCISAGKNCQIGKSDLKSAFRHLGIRMSDWCLLIMKAESPLEAGKIYYFVDKCLPFGAAISCSHFQMFSDALAHIVKVKSGLALNLNYLDDFFFVATLKLICDQNIQLFLNICRDINFPVSLEKTFWGTTQLTFLGLLIDTVRCMVFIPIEKVEKALRLIDQMLIKKKSTIKAIQQLCGILNFFSKCIIPARTFTRRLYSMTAGSTLYNVLKPHHHVNLAQDVRLDLQMWKIFLENPTAYSRPFSDFSITYLATDIDLYTDSSANPNLGCGGVCGNEWFAIAWNPSFFVNNPSINYLELYAVTVAVVTWIHKFSNKKIALFCDNMSVVNMINKTSSNCRNCMVLLRIIVLHGLFHNVKITAKHVMGKNNRLADFLSRKRFSDFRRESNGCHNTEPVEIPSFINSLEKVWYF